ncbi:hypothetical protein D3C74_27050 [compost metagenome]
MGEGRESGEISSVKILKLMIFNEGEQGFTSFEVDVIFVPMTGVQSSRESEQELMIFRLPC